MAQMRFSNDGSTWSEWQTYVASKAWTLQSGDGTKRVYVLYIDNAGQVSAPYYSSITLDTTAPTANAGQSQTVTLGNIVTLDASGSTDSSGIVSYVWDFGDGAQGSGITAAHTYSSPGTYVAKLTVQDSAGNIATATTNIVIQPQPTPTPTPSPTLMPTNAPTAAPTIKPTPTILPTSTPSIPEFPSILIFAAFIVLFSALALYWKKKGSMKKAN